MIHEKKLFTWGWGKVSGPSQLSVLVLLAVSSGQVVFSGGKRQSCCWLEKRKVQDKEMRDRYKSRLWLLPCILCITCNYCNCECVCVWVWVQLCHIVVVPLSEVELNFFSVLFGQGANCALTRICYGLPCLLGCWLKLAWRNGYARQWLPAGTVSVSG